MKKVKFAILFFMVFILLMPSFAKKSKRAITYDDLSKIKWVRGPVISPDGNFLAYTVRKLNKETNSSKSCIYIFDLSKGENLKLTNPNGSDFSPEFSADSKYLYFLSSRSGKTAIWRISMAGGEAQKHLEIPTNITNFKLSDANNLVAFTAFAYPEEKNYDAQVQKLKSEDKKKHSAYVSERLLFRVWNYWRKGKYSTLFVYNPSDEKITQLTSGYYDVPPADLGSSHDLEFSNNGQHIYFVMNKEENVQSSTNNDIFKISVYGGAPEKVTTNPANDNSPLLSNGGSKMSYRAMKRAGFEADKYDIMVKTLATGRLMNLTSGFKWTVNQIKWGAGGKTIYFTAIKEGYNPIYKVKLDTGEIFPVIEKEYIDNFVVSSGGKFIFYTKEQINKPAEVYAFNVNTKEKMQLTHFNDELLSELEMNELEEHWFEGAGGDSVELFVLKPPFFNKNEKYPVIELIHGGPQGMWGDDFHPRWNAQMFAARGYVVLMINFHGSRGYGQPFTDAVSRDWGGKPYIDIVMGTQYAMNNFKFIDSERIGAAGASYGGYMVDWLEGHEHPFKVLVSHAGVYDLESMYGATEELWFPEWEFAGTPWSNPKMYEKFSPSSYVLNFKTPCLVSAGEKDYRVPYTQSLQFFTALQKMNVPSKLIIFPDEDHFVQKPENAAFWWNSVLDWFDKYFK